MFGDLKIVGLLIQAALFVWNFFKKRKAEEAAEEVLDNEKQARLENAKLLNAKPGDGSNAARKLLDDLTGIKEEN